jgi:AraC-like DNA-binding protein
MSYRRFLASVATAIYLYNGLLINTEDAILTRDAADIRDQERNLTSKLFDVQEEMISLHNPYSFEQSVLSAVSEGNEAKLRQRIKSPFSGEIGQMSSNQIQQQKYTFVAFTTLVTRAAIKGGLDPEFAFSMSDIFIQRIDMFHTPDEFTSITYSMALQFTRKVAEIKGLTKLLHPVKPCVEYINSHLHQEIYIRDLAQMVNLTPRVLAKKFLQQMHCSIPEYVNTKKVDEAKSLLQYTDYSISEIGTYLQYNSQSYFTTIFKRFCQMTPQQYRDIMKSRNE